MTTFPPDLIRYILALPTHHLSTTYDAEADVLYISFRKPQQANDTIMGEEGYLYHYRDEALVGLTIMNASQQGNIEG